MDEREQEQRRQLHRGFGASLNNAFEIALVPAFFAGLGWLLDRWLGTGWVFTSVLAVVGLTGTLLKLYYRYCDEMVQLEASGPWRRPQQGPQ